VRGERGRGVYIGGGWLGEGARVVGEKSDPTAAARGMTEPDSRWAMIGGPCLSVSAAAGVVTESGAAALAGWAGFSA
jgi:hypothetical protein